MRDTLPVRVRFGDFELDLRAGELRQGEQTILLQEQPFRLLLMLVEHGSEIATRDEIQKKLWPNDTVVEFDKSITAAIKRLRKALGDSAEHPKYIETVARRGYRLMLPVERVANPAADSPDSDKIPVQANEARTGPPTLTPESQPASLTGKTVSHYRVLDILGGGGMGVVYRAEDLKLGRAVALKFLPEELGDDPKALERFEREARAASALDHPNICSIYEFGEHEGQPFIVMQLLEGQTLREHLASLSLQKSGSDGSCPQAFPLDQLLDVAAQTASGIQAAHERGIIHRDIKPANIFLTTRGLVKILDFGVAKLLQVSDEQHVPAAAPSQPGKDLKGHAFRRAVPDAPPLPSGLQPATDSALTRTGAAMGTAGYMSPEQVRGENVDARTDLFSFGLVLYEMATGQRAFGGDTAAIVHNAILNQTPAPVHERNATIPPKLEQIIGHTIEKDRERRYQSAAEMRADLESVAADQSKRFEGDKSRKRSKWQWLATAAVVGIAMIAGGLYWYWRSHKPVKLTDKDTIVLADFENATGDAVFDDTLKRGLFIQLRQSPFLELLPDRKVNATLKRMGRHAGDPLTPEIAREVCQRTGAKAMLAGSIAETGTKYIVGLRATNCYTGGLLAEVEEDAPDRNAVLKALDAAALNVRTKLGESLSSVQKYSTPLSEATTPSLEALKAYSLGAKTSFVKGWTAALPFYKRAVELDPNFASAYQALSTAYGNLNEAGRAEENARRAYELRTTVSDRERFQIESKYYGNTTGELEKEARTYQQWIQNYPRDVVAHGNLGSAYGRLGNLDKALEESQVAMRLDPNEVAVYINLAAAYENLNQLDEAEQVYKQAEDRKLVGETLLQYWYLLAFLKGDTDQMAQMAAAATGKPGKEDALLTSQADTEAWYGRLRKARELTQQAISSAERNDAKETAANYQAGAALREVAAGNRELARADANAALKLAQNRKVREMAALALALAGDGDAAEKLADELNQAYPLDTQVQRYWLPTIRAAVAVSGKDPNRAVELLEPTNAMDLALVNTGANIFLCPAYVRGEAYLMLHNGPAAAAEFQKFIDHYGLLTNFPWGALARLGLARAYTLEATTDPTARDKARAAYQNFLTLWKDADSDIPIYQQAKAEYARLR